MGIWLTQSEISMFMKALDTVMLISSACTLCTISDI
jgi:hypothetical protein